MVSPSSSFKNLKLRHLDEYIYLRSPNSHTQPLNLFLILSHLCFYQNPKTTCNKQRIKGKETSLSLQMPLATAFTVVFTGVRRSFLVICQSWREGVAAATVGPPRSHPRLLLVTVLCQPWLLLESFATVEELLEANVIFYHCCTGVYRSTAKVLVVQSHWKGPGIAALACEATVLAAPSAMRLLLPLDQLWAAIYYSVDGSNEPLTKPWFLFLLISLFFYAFVI